MDSALYQDLMILSGAIVTIGGAILTLQKISSNHQKDKRELQAKILQQAKEEINSVRLELETQIKVLEVEVHNLEESVSKDLLHIKESYDSEIKNLGEKIDAMRVELRDQSLQIVSLLTKMIGNSKD